MLPLTPLRGVNRATLDHTGGSKSSQRPARTSLEFGLGQPKELSTRRSLGLGTAPFSCSRSEHPKGRLRCQIFALAGANPSVGQEATLLAQPSVPQPSGAQPSGEHEHQESLARYASTACTNRPVQTSPFGRAPTAPLV